ncbi:hypothetical protein JW707_01945 [Candidatus Woesearchaeota archaeon]|nr:hypothetical protein [Candidatus Woesearchaeota archaeon]
MPEEEKEEEVWINGPEFILPRFNTMHSLVKEQLKHNDANKARESYHRMLEIYAEISKSNLPSEDKKLAYKKLTEAFNEISNPMYEPETGNVAVAKYLIPISVIVIILLIVFFIKPQLALTGLAALSGNTAPEYTGNGEIIVEGNTAVDLNGYFSDAQGDRITYLVTTTPNIDVKISANVLTLDPDPGLKGLRVITIIATDLDKSTTVDVNLIVK